MQITYYANMDAAEAMYQFFQNGSVGSNSIFPVDHAELLRRFRI